MAPGFESLNLGSLDLSGSLWKKKKQIAEQYFGGLREMKCFPLCCSKAPSEAEEGAIETSEGVPTYDQSLHRYSYKELKIASENFGASNKIGDGGFGSVYKAKLKHGAVVAVKVLSPESRQGEREFLAEIAAMSNIKHENLLTLRGFCAEGANRALVYDYMENSSLARTLLGKGYDGSKFKWSARREISVGIAHGLAYLHEETKPYVVHRDIKASNILLDWDFTPKISDFGLAKLFANDISHISTRVAGTLGYLAPEYAVTGQLTKKSDIYSFGVLLLEIISGICATNLAVDLGEPYLLDKAWKLYEASEVEEMADPVLKGEFPVEEVVRFVKVGLLCVQESPGLRPTMATVVKMMTKETKQLSEVEIMPPGTITDLFDMKIVDRRTFHETDYNYKSSTSATTGSSSSTTV